MILSTILILSLLQASEIEYDLVSRREAAVSAAREGDFQAAISALRSLFSRHGEDPLIAADYLTVLHWSGQPEQVVALASSVDLETMPAYGGRALARSFRDLGRYQEAAAIWRRLMASEPESWQDQLGLALTLADTERGLGEDLCADLLLERQELEILVGCAYVARRAGAFLQAVKLGQWALDLEPSHSEAFSLKTMSLADLGAAHKALVEVLDRPSILSAEEIAHLRAGSAARRVIWGEIGTLDPESRFAETEAAIINLDQQIATRDGTPPTFRLEFDRMVAWRDRFRMANVVEFYEDLARQSVEVPAYAVNAVADAYLYLGQPEEALRHYRRVIDAGAGGFETRMALYWALLENEELGDAEAWVEGLAKEQTPWRRQEGTVEVLPNWPRLIADATTAMHLGFTDRQKEAQLRLRALVDRAPFNTGLREQLATIYSFRGWSRLAFDEVTIALHQEPTNMGARLLRASLLLDLHRIAQSESQINELLISYPENKHVQRLADRADLRHRWLAEAEVGVGQSDVAGPSGLGTDDSSVEFRLWAPAFKSLRPFLHTYESRAGLPEGEAVYRRLSAGVAARQGPLWGRLEIGVDRDRTSDTSMAVILGFDLDDHWLLSAGYSSDTLAVPLRARRVGIGGRQSSASLEYRGSDLWRAGANLAVSDYSDDNQRRELGLFGLRRIYTGAIYKSSLRLELFGSNNSRLDAPYYNPSRDRSGLLSWIQEWLGYRHYHRALVHRFVVGTGHYRQDGFGTGSMLQLRYEHDWKVRLGDVLRYGIAWSSRPYDGEREERWSWYANLGWHL